MIYITQLIFVKPGKEEIFLEFESKVLPLLQKHGGEITYRVRPEKESFIDHTEGETPYEIHFVTFPSEADLQGYMKDDSRLKFMHLKEESVRSTLLVKGERM
ncbi:DUF1330 domain-containing protein [Fulvivirga ligni]|uniref:DUF1330 domain-containing protein n=1 Tax=Fulvivirga ligni TaxID=2904246 RepID=UPI001F1D19E3|nr:DUF1330 domain-containing protein [Fulvivirga ligni]UII19872.1 DUF1330 domain-containing protein [Fulvivirga ligni]